MPVHPLPQERRARRALATFFVLVAVLAVQACGPTDTAAAKVGNGEISQAALDEELEAIEGNEDYVRTLQQPQNPQEAPIQIQGRGRGTLDAGFVSRVLTRQILLELVHQKFVAEKLSISDDELEESRAQVAEQVAGPEIFAKFPKRYQDTLARRNAEVTKLQQKLVPAITDEQVQAFYEENAAQFQQQCPRHILVDTKEQADALRVQIAGGTPFEQVAAATSKDTSSKDQGGDLECQPVGTFVPPIEEALGRLQVNELSQPVQTDFGFHLILLYDRKVQSLEEATPQIRQQLQSQGNDAFNEFLTNAAANAKITVNPRYGRWDRTQPPGSVVPPQSPTTAPQADAPGEAPLQPEG